jgi:hypothetical protein
LRSSKYQTSSWLTFGYSLLNKNGL